MDKHSALVANMVTTYINENGIGVLADYDVPAAVAMLIKWADEDGVTVTGLSADDVATVVESYRGVAA